METHLESEAIELVYSASPLQDGDTSLHTSAPPPGHVGDADSPGGRLFSHALPLRVSEGLDLRLRGDPLPLQGSPLRPVNSPRVFTRVARVTAAYIRWRGIRILMYLDDWLLVAGRSDIAVRTHTVGPGPHPQTGLGRQLGQVGTPAVVMPHLSGSNSGLPPGTGMSLGGEMSGSTGRSSPTPTQATSQSLASFLGYFASLADIVPWCRLRMRELQWHLLAYFRPASRDLSSVPPLTPSVVPLLRQWWQDADSLFQGLSFLPPSRHSR